MNNATLTTDRLRNFAALDCLRNSLSNTAVVDDRAVLARLRSYSQDKRAPVSNVAVGHGTQDGYSLCARPR